MQREALHFGAWNDDARGVAAFVELGFDSQAGGGPGVPDQGHHGFERAQRAPAPVLRDVTEQAVLDLVPLARARREVRHMDGEAQGVGEALEAGLPRARPKIGRASCRERVCLAV